MGTLLGHLTPGIFFLLIGLWWTYNVFERYFQARQLRRHFYATASFSLRRGSRIAWENVIVLVLAVIAIIGELVTGWRDGKLVEMGNGQHATMYLMFGLACVVEIARRCGLELVPGLEYVMMVMAFTAEALLFALHGHGTSDMEMLVHRLLLYAVLGNIGSAVVEMLHRRSVLAALARAFFTLLQGTWFIQVGFILFPPDGWNGWDVNSYRQQKLATAVFVWHWVGVLVAMAAMGLALRSRSRTCVRGRSASAEDAGPGADSSKLLYSSEDEL